MTPVTVFPADAGDPVRLEGMARHLRSGGLLVYPTETVYGLGASADPAGVAAVRRMKGREGNHPFLLLVPPGLEGAADPRLSRLSWSEGARRLAGAFWPGPLTLVLPDPEGRFPEGIRSEKCGVAVRVSSHAFVEALMRHWMLPLISTSANCSGSPPASHLEEVLDSLKDRPGADRLWVADAGPLPVARPSTVVDCTGRDPEMVREGEVHPAALARVLAGGDAHGR